MTQVASAPMGILRDDSVDRIPSPDSTADSPRMKFKFDAPSEGSDQEDYVPTITWGHKNGGWGDRAELGWASESETSQSDTEKLIKQPKPEETPVQPKEEPEKITEDTNYDTPETTSDQVDQPLANSQEIQQTPSITYNGSLQRKNLMGCFNCGQEGHRHKECTNPKMKKAHKRRLSHEISALRQKEGYVPPVPTFANVTKGHQRSGSGEILRPKSVKSHQRSFSLSDNSRSLTQSGPVVLQPVPDEPWKKSHKKSASYAGSPPVNRNDRLSPTGQTTRQKKTKRLSVRRGSSGSPTYFDDGWNTTGDYVESKDKKIPAENNFTTDSTFSALDSESDEDELNTEIPIEKNQENPDQVIEEKDDPIIQENKITEKLEVKDETIEKIVEKIVEKKILVDSKNESMQKKNNEFQISNNSQIDSNQTQAKPKSKNRKNKKKKTVIEKKANQPKKGIFISQEILFGFIAFGILLALIYFFRSQIASFLTSF